ncbi:hypothetical protein [Luteimicrobium subarcticum]|uniref:hypothetical protein n=1 Tax=Luteimicrobium subarcticum TaxID=620910 RepID=UPI0012FD4F12|nr:hypothetical protein [Luteimicrobium subarcticum]
MTPTDRTTGTSAVARESFRDPVGLWRATPGRASHVVDAATDLLVLGYDASALGELAGMSPCASFYDVDPVLTTVLDQVGAADLLGRGADRAGLEAHLGLFLDRTITLRELSTWAHQTIGHDGEEDLQPFVELDDVYDDWEYSGEDLCSLDTVTRQAARDFLAGRSVTRFDGLEPSPPAATTVARPPGWLDRLRRRGGQPAP